MKQLKYTLLLFVCAFSLSALAQASADGSNTIETDWESVSLGKLQKKPLFKDPAISVKFTSDGGTESLHLALKYMFTDAVFDDAVPVEYYKNQKIEFNTDGGKYELSAAKYAKARRMNYVAQKTADLKVAFLGDITFLKDKLVKGFTVHYAQGYQNISINKEEAILLQNAYIKFSGSLKAKTVKTKVAASPRAVVVEEKIEKVEEDTSTSPPINKLRKQAKRWGR